MMRRLAVAITFFASIAAPAASDLEESVEAAIAKGVSFLRKQIETDPWWKSDQGAGAPEPRPGRAQGKGGRKGRRPQEPAHLMGKAAIELYALIQSDVSVDDPLISRGFEFLEKLEPRQVYDVSLYLMALDAAWEQPEADLVLLRSAATGVRLNPKVTQKLRTRMEELAGWLVAARHEGQGAWGYGSRNTRPDNSNTQFAVLGLGVAARRGIAIGQEVCIPFNPQGSANDRKDGIARWRAWYESTRRP
jgi:hypothetical protein